MIYVTTALNFITAAVNIFLMIYGENGIVVGILGASEYIVEFDSCKDKTFKLTSEYLNSAD